MSEDFYKFLSEAISRAEDESILRVSEGDTLVEVPVRCSKCRHEFEVSNIQYGHGDSSADVRCMCGTFNTMGWSSYTPRKEWASKKLPYITLDRVQDPFFRGRIR